ncbi:hypothetical protein OG407_49375 [Streptomyces sp. NBC_01515]|uniref:hypothetical protein n=1 Tax=Streptomyces sp. NBC_01515 TaxID=2903890 RepID=UPI0038684B2E
MSHTETAFGESGFEFPRWRVLLDTLTLDGRPGELTIIVTAATTSDAEQAAWGLAHSRDAIRHRRGASITTQRTQVHAHPVPAPF